MLVGAALLGALAPTPAPAVPGPPPVPGAPIQLVPGDLGEGLRIRLDSVQLEPVTAIELAGGSALAQPGGRVLSRGDGSGLRAEAGLQVTPLRTMIERELPNVWEYRRHAAKRNPTLPQVSVVLREMSNAEQVAALERGDIDLALLHPPVSVNLKVHERQLGHDRLIAALPAAHALADDGCVSLAEVAQRGLVWFPEVQMPADTARRIPGPPDRQDS